MEVSELEQKIRALINCGRLQAEVLSNDTSWNMLCSSLDLIGDTGLALDSYSGMAECRGPGKSYLLVYGVLQTLLLQQDAAKHIAKALNVKFKLPKQLSEIRIVRNSAAGHPGFQMENKEARSCFISRSSLTTKEFDLLTFYSGGKEHQKKHICIPDILIVQAKHMESILTLVLTDLERREKDHYKMHQNTKLLSNFSGSTSYYFEKIFEATMSDSKYPLGGSHIELVTNSLSKFKEEMEERNEWGVNRDIEYHYSYAEYASKELVAYFLSKEESRLNDTDAFIFASFLQNCVVALKNHAATIDQEYEREGPE